MPRSDPHNVNVLSLILVYPPTTPQSFSLLRLRRVDRCKPKACYLFLLKLRQGASIVHSVLSPPSLQLLICLICLSVENFDQQILRSLLHIRACLFLSNIGDKV